MRALRLALSVTALALLAGCGSVPAAAPEPAPAPAPETPDPSVVLLQPFAEVGGGGGVSNVFCRVGFHYVYPPDLPVHSREVFYEVVGSPMLSGGGPLPLPRPEEDPRPQQRDDGLMELEVTIASFASCLRPQGEPRVIEFTIGDCVEGDCPPMRFEAPEATEFVELRPAEG